MWRVLKYPFARHKVYFIKMNNGWIKLHRKLLNNPVIMKDADHFAIWNWILLNAVHSGIDVMFSGKRISLKPGEFTTGRKIIAKNLKISESKTQRVLKCFESEQQIEQRTDRQCRLIKVLNWDEYQGSEQRNEHQMNNDRTTSEQRVNTKEECNNNNNKNIRYTSFSEFWKIYPRKVGKVSAEKKWKTLKVDEELFSRIKKSLDAQKKTKQWQDKNFIPHPATWLGQKRWQDEVEEYNPSNSELITEYKSIGFSEFRKKHGYKEAVRTSDLIAES